MNKDRDKLTHQKDGHLNMVNVGDKPVTCRRATAVARIDLKSAYQAVKENQLKKGSVIECARIAGIMAAKRTDELIPLCHPLILSHISLDFSFSENELVIHSQVECESKTGVEMEALTAVSVACLTVYDMAKSVEKGIEIKEIRLVKKQGGKSGDWENLR